jgi:type IV pilus assembly protein PilA
MTNPPDQPYNPPNADLTQSGPSIATKTSTLAIVALVLACLPFCFLNFVGLALGIAAWVRISGRPQELKGKGLAIAAVIVGFVWLPLLVAIAVPNFLRFQARAKQSEAKVNLKEAYAAEKSYFAEFERYTEDPAEHDWRPKLGSRYTYYIGKNVFAPTFKEATTLAAPEDAQSYVRDDAFRLVAVGNLDSDDTLDVWVIDENNELVNTSNDITE